MKRVRSGSIWGLAMLVTGAAACSDRDPVLPDVPTIQAVKAVDGDVKVRDTDPPGAEQETTLDVRVLGSGFDDGTRTAAVTMLLGGQAQPVEVRTNKTTFVSDRELIANVTIDPEATVGLWDVEVMTLRGKKGIGIEMFEVKEKVPPGQVVFDAYTAIDLGTLGRRKGVSRAHDIGEPSAGVLLVTGTSQPDARSSEMPVTWEVTLTATDTTWTGPTPMPLPSGDFFSGRAGKIGGDFITGWVFRSEYVDGEPVSRAVRWRYQHGVDEVVVLEPVVLLDPDIGFLASAGRGVNTQGDVVGNSSMDHPVYWDVDGDGVSELEGTRIATLWAGDTSEPTPLLSPLRGQSIAYAINDGGYVVGTGEEPGHFDPGGEPERHAVLWLPDGTPCDLGTSGVQSEAYGIIDTGVPGMFLVSGIWDSRLTVWQVTPDEAAQTCPANRWTLDVSSIGGGIRVVDGGWEVAGMGEIITPGQHHPLSWRLGPLGSTVTPLGEAGRGMGLNSAGLIVGFAPVSDLDHAMLWVPRNQ